MMEFFALFFIDLFKAIVWPAVIILVADRLSRAKIHFHFQIHHKEIDK